MTDNFSGLPDHDNLSHGAPGGTAGGEPTPSAQPVDRTGNPAVDRVLASLDALGDTPVAEHVAVFESAHGQLRSALAGAVDDTAPSRG